MTHYFARRRFAADSSAVSPAALSITPHQIARRRAIANLRPSANVSVIMARDISIGFAGGAMALAMNTGLPQTFFIFADEGSADGGLTILA